MKPSSIVLGSLALLGLLALGQAVLSPSSRAPARVAARSESLRPEAWAPTSTPELHRPHVPERSTAFAIAAEGEARDSAPSVVPASSCGPVKVHGRVRRAGALVALCDLSFVASGEGELAREADWDFSDGEGRYEVRLLPGAYRVRRGEEGAWLADVRVPDGAQEFEFDLSISTGALR